MTRTGWFFVYLIVAVLIGAGYGLMNWRQKGSKREINHLFLLAELVSVLYAFSFLTDSFPAQRLLYNAVLYLEGLMTFAFLLYTLRITMADKPEKRTYRIVTQVVYVADLLMFTLNEWTGWVAVYRQEEHSGELYLKMEPQLWFYVHAAFCYLMVLTVIMFTIRKMCRIPTIYWTRYLVVLLVFLMGVVFDALFVFANFYIDFCICMMIPLGFLIYYYMFHYMEYVSQQNLKDHVIDRLDYPVLLFDYDDILQLYNKPAEAELDLKPYMNLFDFAARNRLEYLVNPEARKAGRTKVFSMADYRKRIYMIQGHELEKKGKFVGTLILYDDITSTETFKDESSYLATHDQLTGLWNREFFFDGMTRVMTEHPEQEFVIVVIDIFQFRMFNEILGKRLGDDVLVTLANALKSKHTELCVEGRTYGDRFAVLLPKEQYVEQELLAQCGQAVEKRNYALKVHLYFGVYDITDRKLAVEQMYDRAYMALDSVKGDANKQIAYFEETMRERLVETALTADELEEAMREEQFVIWLQPQIDMQTDRLAGAEALVRWDSPKHGIVTPYKFVPFFEENGQITKLDYMVWEMACRLLKKWEQEGRSDWTVSINISAKDFYLTDLYSDIVGLVEKYQVAPAKLRLEITETAIIINVNELMNVVTKLQDYGFLIEMDDFGSGYSSLNSLKDISVDILKLDMKFFEKSQNPVRSEIIVKSVIELAHELNMPVIAEGAENEQHIELLKRVGCRLVQGYYYSKPMPVADFEEFAKGREYLDVRSLIRE